MDILVIRWGIFALAVVGFEIVGLVVYWLYKQEVCIFRRLVRLIHRPVGESMGGRNGQFQWVGDWELIW